MRWMETWFLLGHILQLRYEIFGSTKYLWASLDPVSRSRAGDRE